MRKLKISAVMLISLLSQNIFVAQASIEGSTNDPLARLNYRTIFGQKHIHEKHNLLMLYRGCEKNVFTDRELHEVKELERKQKTAIKEKLMKQESFSPHHLSKPTYSMVKSACEDMKEEKLPIDEEVDVIYYLQFKDDQLAKKIKLYEEDCLDLLRNEKKRILLKQAKENSLVLLFMGGAAGTFLYSLGRSSYGGGYASVYLTMNSMPILRSIINSVSNFISLPSHPLDELEERFSVNQCFIPKELWPSLIRNFMIARQNLFLQQKALEFIEFTLGLTIYRKKPELTIKSTTQQALTITDSVKESLDELSTKIDTFFRDYDPFMRNDQKLILKMNISKFVLSLVIQETPPKYLYIHGVEGIGKTYFVGEIKKWLEELVPGGIHFENFTISSAEELEGASDRPGVFLRALRNQTVAQKNGSVIFMDEATWINRKDMEGAIKRVFNGNLAQISTAMFGAGVDGAGIKLEIPPMLIIASGNDPIKDIAIESRFDSIEFPLPTEDALLRYGMGLLKRNKFIQIQSGNSNTSLISDEIIFPKESLVKFESTLRKRLYGSLNTDELYNSNREADESIHKRKNFRKTESTVSALSYIYAIDGISKEL